MRWESGDRSSDIEDRRGRGGLPFGGGGGFPGVRMGLGGTLVLGVLSLVFGRDFFSLLGGDGLDAPVAPGERATPYQGSADEEKLVDFVSFVLDDVQRTWNRALGNRYENARLVLFTDRVRSACGAAEAAMGPFYCPADEKVYVDLGFYRELRSRFGAPGDFAQAYVIAHEIGHHVQHRLGISDRVQAARRSRPRDANALSVRLELQADCFAGIWAHSTSQRKLLEAGDVEEAMGAAAAIGDDRLQRGSTGRVNPETWTHGSSEQRTTWFRRGLQSGELDSCDTFAAGSP